MDIICFCHLRWNFVYQRPQHLMSRFARQSRVFVFEEPLIGEGEPVLKITTSKEGVYVLTPILPAGSTEQDKTVLQQSLLKEFFDNHQVSDYIAWYYTPLMIDIGEALPKPQLIVYDCMDQLSAFKNAHAALPQKEKALFHSANLVFTGGYSLYEEKKHMHDAIFPFPSSIDKDHFHQARNIQTEVSEQTVIKRPRIGYFGVIDERLDISLVAAVAQLKPDWEFIFIGPTVKIDPADLPAAPNIHYLGSKPYEALPGYLAGWDVAMIPFALNESTRFISPTKTPEYLAGGIPVVATSIRDIINPYKVENLVYIANTPDEFVDSIENALSKRHDPEWLKKVDSFLKNMSWDNTWKEMDNLMREKIRIMQMPKPQKENEYV